LIRGSGHPKPRSIRQNLFSEADDAFYVEFVKTRILKLDSGKRDFLAHLVALALVGFGIDLFLIQERFIEQGLTAFDFLKSPLKVCAQVSGSGGPLLPQIERL
jgi:hypothetical protein